MTTKFRARGYGLACFLAAAGVLIAVTGCQEKPAAAPAGYYTGPMKGKSVKTTTDTPGANGNGTNNLK